MGQRPEHSGHLPRQKAEQPRGTPSNPGYQHYQKMVLSEEDQLKDKTWTSLFRTHAYICSKSEVTSEVSESKTYKKPSLLWKLLLQHYIFFIAPEKRALKHYFNLINPQSLLGLVTD